MKIETAFPFKIGRPVGVELCSYRATAAALRPCAAVPHIAPGPCLYFFLPRYRHFDFMTS